MYKGIFRAVAIGLAVFTLNAGLAFAQFVDPWPCNCTYSESFHCRDLGGGRLEIDGVETRVVASTPSKLSYSLRRGESYSLAFTYTGGAGMFSMIPPPSSTGAALSDKFIVLSDRPGDFDKTGKSPMCYANTSAGGFANIRYDDDPSSATACQLEPGRTYYLNIRDGVSMHGTIYDSCPAGAQCGFTIQQLDSSLPPAPPGLPGAGTLVPEGSIPYAGVTCAALTP